MPRISLLKKSSKAITPQCRKTFAEYWCVYRLYIEEVTPILIPRRPHLQSTRNIPVPEGAYYLSPPCLRAQACPPIPIRNLVHQGIFDLQ